MKKESALVIFTKEYPNKNKTWWKKFSLVLAHKSLESIVKEYGLVFVNIEDLIGPGSIYEANNFAKELSYLKLSDGPRISKSFIYKGYELWWIHYQNLFLYFCLPYTQYRKLLEHLRSFQNISFYQPPHKNLFSCYLNAYKCRVSITGNKSFKIFSNFSFGLFLQIIFTLISIPILIIMRYPIMIFIGDKFDSGKDYDFRMEFIYKELRERNLKFVEFIRSVSSWETLLKHALKRKRPVIYSEGVTFIGRFMSVIFAGRYRAIRKYGPNTFSTETDPEKKFKLFIATQYLLGIYDDIWAIQIMKLILKIIGVKTTIVTAALERNFHSVLGCKLNNIPIVGILHGANTHNYNIYDFMNGFDGEKMLSVDKYGLWSAWWRQYYIKNSKAYKPEQLYVSGPMRPLQKTVNIGKSNNLQKIKVLLVSEIVAVPTEIMPYLDAILRTKDFSVYIKFRVHGDSFEEWLKINRPDILSKLGEGKILKGNMHDAIELCDAVIGSQSTGVIEATLQLKPFVFFNTKKWGDYFDMKSFDPKYNLFAENPQELISYIRESMEIPDDTLKNLRDKFFGDPHKNGSKWVVEEVERILQKTN